MDPLAFALSSPQITPDFYLPLHRPRKKQRPRIIEIDDGAVTGGRNPKFPTKQFSAPNQCPTPPCTECGKKFFSWKALFGHMRCHPERQWRGIRRPSTLAPNSSIESPNSFNTDEIEVATCLLMLSNRSGVILAREEEEQSRFECSSCKKVFGSHQALGGHRASHKNVKGCSAINRSDDTIVGGDDDGTVGDGCVQLVIPTLGHQCNTCLKIFSSGQALGGHKRCHWEKNEEPSCNSQVYSVDVGKCCSDLDLNLPPALMEEEFSVLYNVDLDLRLGF